MRKIGLDPARRDALICMPDFDDFKKLRGQSYTPHLSTIRPVAFCKDDPKKVLLPGDVDYRTVFEALTYYRMVIAATNLIEYDDDQYFETALKSMRGGESFTKEQMKLAEESMQTPQDVRQRITDRLLAMRWAVDLLGDKKMPSRIARMEGQTSKFIHFQTRAEKENELYR
jgi:hypothetical protein